MSALQPQIAAYPHAATAFFPGSAAAAAAANAQLLPATAIIHPADQAILAAAAAAAASNGHPPPAPHQQQPPQANGHHTANGGSTPVSQHALVQHQQQQQQQQVVLQQQQQQHVKPRSDRIEVSEVFSLGRVVDANKRTVTTQSYSFLYEIRFGHNMSSCLFSFSIIGHTWPKLRFAIIKCMCCKFSRYVSLVNI